MMRAPLLVMLCLWTFNLTGQINSGHLIWKVENKFNLPARQSFSGFQLENYILWVGGRKDGLHETVPFRSFPAAERADHLFLLDLNNGVQWTADLNDLSPAVQEQLSSGNMLFGQHEQYGYLVGGYGASELEGDHITFGRITRIDLQGIIEAIKGGASLRPFVTSVADSFFELTGGNMIYLDGRWHMVGGQSFMGRYNPVGPNMGPGFVQHYSNAIRSFSIESSEVAIQITDKEILVDSNFLHKRDYNLLPQILPGGTYGGTAFSGVFRYDQDLPWLECIDITADSFTYMPEYKQYLNQYHCASFAFYSADEEVMQSVFFGGMSQFYWEDDMLKEDLEVPFIKTVSMIERKGKKLPREYILGRLPDFLGTSAQFFHHPDIPEYNEGIIATDELSSIGDTVLLGYVMGGITADSANVLFTNDGTQSHAVQQCFGIYWVNKPDTSAHQLTGMDYFRPKFNRRDGNIHLEFRTLDEAFLELVMVDKNGQEVKALYKGNLAKGTHQLSYPIGDIPASAKKLLLRKGAFQWNADL